MYNNKNKLYWLALLILSALLIGAHANAQTYNLKLAHSWQKNSEYANAMREVQTLARRLSGGRLIISVDSAEQHRKPQQVFEMVRTGRYDIGFSGMEFTSVDDPNLLLVSSVPFGMITSEFRSWYYNGAGQELMDRVYAKYGLKAFPGGNAGNLMAGWFNKEIKEIDDLRGTKMSSVGISSTILKRVGVDIVEIPADQLKNALQNRVIDSAQFGTPVQDMRLGLHEVAKFYYTGWQSPSTERQFLVNAKVYEKLPQELRETLKSVFRLASQNLTYAIFDQNTHSVRDLRVRHSNVVLRSLPSPVIRRLRSEFDAYLQEILQQDADGLTQEIIDSISKYKRRARLWTRLSDQTYLNNIGL